MLLVANLGIKIDKSKSICCFFMQKSEKIFVFGVCL